METRYTRTKILSCFCQRCFCYLTVDCRGQKIFLWIFVSYFLRFLYGIHFLELRRLLYFFFECTTKTLSKNEL